MATFYKNNSIEGRGLKAGVWENHDTFGKKLWKGEIE